MSTLFADHARRLSGVVCRRLFWQPRDFWRATPREITTVFLEEPDADQPQVDRQWLCEMMERDAHGR